MKNSTTAISSLLLLFFLFSVHSTDAQNKKQSHVKIIKIVDGDTTIIEKILNDSEPDEEIINNENSSVKIYKQNSKNKSEAYSYTINSDSIMRILHQNMDSMLAVINKTIEIRTEGKDSVLEFKFNGTPYKSFEWMSDSVLKGFEFKTFTGNGDEDVFLFSTPADANGKKIIVTTNVKTIECLNDNSKTKNNNQTTHFNFYPNPNNGTFTLEYENSTKEKAVINITDINGKILFNEEVKGDKKINKRINLGDQAQGTYIVTVKEGKNTITKKIIIKH